MYDDYQDEPFEAPERGCGTRKKGGIYAVTPLGKHGQPVEAFLLCPPKLLNFDVPVRGMLPVVLNGTTNLIDWVGAQYYPNVADFVEEVRLFGLSRAMSPTAPFEELTAQSRLITVHPRAWIHNISEYGIPYWTCPKNIRGHGFTDPGTAEVPMCAGAYWWDVTDGEPLEVAAGTRQADDAERAVTRQMPSFRYFAHCRPEGVVPEYSPAAFAAWPIAKLQVIRGEYGEHEPAIDRLSGSDLNLPWELCDE